MLHARISGLASYAPDDILDNEMLSKMVDTNDEWITTRVGIKERRILREPGKGSSYLGIKAVEKLLERTGTKPEEVDLLICATSNPDYRFPSTGSVIAHQLGLKNAYAYDVQAACAGFLVALEDGSAYVRSGLRKKVVVVAAEKMSSMTNYQDRATCPLFGDGAGAMLLEPTEDNVGVMDGVFHVDGEGLEHLWMPAGGSVLPASHETVDAQQHFVIQDGRNVYKNAVTDMLESSLEVMKRNDLTVDNIDWFVSHQANLRIIEAVGSRLGIDTNKVLVNIEKYGNTSAASVPLCLDEYQDRLKKGDKIILTAFGAGFTWGAMYIIWDL
ncbi:beta-ketoacyl-ACP synthase III [uncultured Duncaniella sp.]|uniref:beta-ketoacyl-ACP synthase III n=1 Tax=uncultured Duncaniella sp. TaxID=2768039 RepID=UPI0023D50DF8|nr:beta-ketoacyl-ACP synthase III [uncultured Duncaniella sp.]MDE5666386.1 ketoacyl-ACP synthase III [Duncaniella sp.]MDE5672787.1 ketoacyl-ACP synthase III [Duncaniella sp.]MDE5961930.1 ketoacyl-ACP synthase III [Duncaniella sp.]MDE6186779.1 ketoacyl-ACP synthase III [Duncaniella sp.]